jgi:hypothetical protein
MSSARLEVIKDDAETPACMSRSMPAALVGLVTQAALDDFCDKLDALFVVSHAESQRVRKRECWRLGGLCFWLIVWIVYNFSGVNIPYWVHIAVWITIAVYFGIVFWCTQPGAGAKSTKEILQLIRFECDEMSCRTPFVSFHVAAGDVNHIDVSISMSATSSGVATTSNAVTDRMSDSKINESIGNHQPVVYAQAGTTSMTTNGDYQQLNDVV